MISLTPAAGPDGNQMDSRPPPEGEARLITRAGFAGDSERLPAAGGALRAVRKDFRLPEVTLREIRKDFRLPEAK